MLKFNLGINKLFFFIATHFSKRKKRYLIKSPCKHTNNTVSWKTEGGKAHVYGIHLAEFTWNVLGHLMKNNAEIYEFMVDDFLEYYYLRIIIISE